MPRVIKNEAGEDVEVFDKAEIEQRESKIKELESDLSVNPSNAAFKQLRKEREQLTKEKEDWMKKAQEAGVKVETPPGISTEEISRIASESAEKTYMSRYKDRVLNQYGDRRETVEKYFEKLSAGENLTEDTIDRLVADAARAVGVNRSPNKDVSSQFGRQGSAPKFVPEVQDEGFGTTTQGKATASAMGLMIEPPKKN